MPSTTAMVLVSPPCLRIGRQTERWPSTRTMLVWIACASRALPTSRTSTDACPTGLQRHVIDGLRSGCLAVGVEVVVVGTDLYVACRKNQVALVDRPNHIHHR